ncbi:MAG: hypothetical protein FWH23_08065 [Bacteroidales bacterium]|nr:hypothetical protein [Bacteroidales bacterium]
MSTFLNPTAKRCKLLAAAFIILLANMVHAQTAENDYTITSVDKLVKDFVNPNDNTTPLNAFLTYNYVLANGKWEDINRLSSATNKRLQTEEQGNKEWLLDRTIKEVLVYKDSVAGMVMADKNPSYTLWFFRFENGQWLNVGEGLGGKSIEETRQIFFKQSTVELLETARRIAQLEVVSTDTAAFVQYLREHGKQPDAFLLDALSRYKLVVYGEIHNQKASWDLMRKLIHRPEFMQSAGVVFLELSMSAQPHLDSFFNNKTKEPDIVLDIFRKEEMNGWPDSKDMFEFILDLWDINYASENKIKVITADFPRPFHTQITTKEQYQAFFEDLPDRNLCMADIIEGHINATDDKRNCLFIVGAGHAYKSSVLHRSGVQQTGRSAVSLLLERLPEESVFSIFTHRPMVSNKGYLYGHLRKGLFDYVFAYTGNQPAAFNLHNSPFGRELFDGGHIRFKANAGSYEDNYDAYIFLEPLDTELNSPYLYELYTDEFVEEIKRRASIIGIENDLYWGMKIKDLNREHIISNLKKDEGRKRWDFEGK